jgi:hypothetical protein
MANKIFIDAEGYQYKLDETFNNRLHLIGWASNNGTIPNVSTITPGQIQQLYCDSEIPERTTFPVHAHGTLTKIKITRWKTLTSFLPNASVLSTLTELEINGTEINALSGAYTQLNDIMLVRNPQMRSLTATMVSVDRVIIVECPLTIIPNYANAIYLKLYKTQVPSLASGSWVALHTLDLYPKFNDSTFDCSGLGSIKTITTRKDVVLTCHQNTHVIIEDDN